MRDPERIPKILHLIYRVWKKYPDLRLMQLLLNASPSLESQDFYTLEDDVLEVRVKALYNDKI